MDIELFGQFGQRLSPLSAAKATFALKAGLWFRPALFVMLSPVHGSLRRVQAEIPFIQVVQISRASSTLGGACPARHDILCLSRRVPREIYDHWASDCSALIPGRKKYPPPRTVTNLGMGIRKFVGLC
jgi:hypothetical protein